MAYNSGLKIFNRSKEEAIICYKGFKSENGKLRCIDMEYIPGAIHVASSPIKLCSNGFHCCHTLDQVGKHYDFTTPENVFYKVKVWGEIVEDADAYAPKMAVQYIQVLEEVSKNELFFARLRNDLDVVDKILEDNPNLILGGSLALILRGLMPYRNINDYDFVLPYFGGFSQSTLSEQQDGYGGSTSSVKMTLQVSDVNIDYDVFINPYETYDVVELPDGRKYKLVDPATTFKAKMEYALGGNVKHLEDIKNFIIAIQKRQEDKSPGFYTNGKMSIREVFMCEETIGKDRYKLDLRSRRGWE